MAQYIIFALYRGMYNPARNDHSGVKHEVVTSATSLKTARQRAYRAAKKHNQAEYIGIQTIKDFHNVSKIPSMKVRVGEDGKVYMTVGRKKRQLLSTGEFAKDIDRKKSEDIFAWYSGETAKPKTVKKPTVKNGTPGSSQFLKDHIIIARPKPVTVSPREFYERFQGYYSAYLHGKDKEYGTYYKLVDMGDKLINKHDPWVAKLVNERPLPGGLKGNPLTSDREVAAFAKTYIYYKRKGMI